MTTFVLIHGAYQGGWIWQPTAARLRAAGHLVYAPSLDGCAERRHSLRPGITIATHATEIAELMFYEDLNDVVLAGTSAGGMVLCRAAELARERIGRLVFIDALALLDGERHRPDCQSNRARASRPRSRPGRRARMPKTACFADLDPALRAFALARYTPHPIAAMEEPVSLKSFWSQSWPTTVIRCRRAANPREAHQRRTAEKLDAKYLEIDSRPLPDAVRPGALAPLLMAG